MTNGDSIRKMTDEELARFIEKIHDDHMIPYVDLKRWLLSEDPRYVYKGRPGYYLEGMSPYEIALSKAMGEPPHVRAVPCTIIEKRKMMECDYYNLILEETGLFLSVPAEAVREL